MQSRASLVALPRELQDAIVHLLVDAHQRGKGLLELSYTNKQFRAMCLPIIYEEIKLYDYFNKSYIRRYRPEQILAQTVSTSPTKVGQYIKRLELSGVEVRDGIAEQMLPYLVNLKTFIYKFEILCNENALGTWLNTKNFGHALASVARSLEHLEITYQHQSDELRGIGPVFPPGPIISKELVALKVLLAPMSLLLGWRTDSSPRFADVLPKSLVQLDIHYDLDQPRGYTWESKDMLAALEVFVQNASWKQTTPDMKAIAVYDMAWSEVIDVRDRAHATAKRIAEENGIAYHASRSDTWLRPDAGCYWGLYD